MRTKIVVYIWGIFIASGLGLSYAQEDPRDLYHQALEARGNNDLAKAREIYQQILKDHPEFKDREMIASELREINLDILVASLKAPSVVHEVSEGETLGKIAGKYGTTVDLIKRQNRLQSNIIRIGQKLKVWTGSFSIYIDKKANTLTVKNGEDTLKTYPISTGKGDSTPEGEFTITTKMEHPVWYHKGEIVPPGKDNFLGTRWLGFNLPQYGIHGTLAPELIGQSVSHGCVRMHNEDVEELFEYIPEGTKVQIVKETVAALPQEKK